MTTKKATKDPQDWQDEYFEEAVEFLGTKSSVAEALGIHRNMVSWYDRGNLMKPAVAFKFNSIFEWAKCEKIHPDVWTKAMMDFQRRRWKASRNK